VTEMLETTVENRKRWIFDLAFALLCAIAFFKSVRTTGDLSWPHDLDEFREIGMAQSVLDGRYGTDHLYLGETVWYNPLTSTVAAALAGASRVPISVIVTRAGAYLNLLAPISFYLLVLLLFERPVALAAGAAFLFAPIGNAPSWAAASYSPWIFSQNFAQVFFYLTLIALIKALGSASLRWYFVCGILLGITFLGHTAPAVLFGAVAVVVSAASLFRRAPGNLRAVFGSPEVRGSLLTLLVAFVISLPFTFSILFHYRLTIRNPIPGNWIYAPLAKENFLRLVASYLTLFGLIAAIGLIFVARNSLWPRRVLLLTWLGVCLLFLAIGELQQVASPDLHLLFAPAHHFLFYFHALETVLFGAGAVFVCRLIGQRFVSRIFWAETAMLAVTIVCFVALAWPSYSRRFDFTTARDEAIGFQERADYLAAYRWILANTKPTDVFLSLTGDLDLSIVGPADRKTVVTCQPEFSSPYVDWKSRSATAANIVEELAHTSLDAIALLARNKVAYVITWPVGGVDLDKLSFLSKQFSEGNIVIYKVISE